ncbi:MAG: hypothetical protein ACK2UY_13560, partial [Anaerolineae bacterium]
LTVANMVTLALMFGVSMSWGRVNDAISVVWLLSFLPLALLLAQVNQSVMGRAVAVGTAIVGMVAMLVFALLQSLLVVGQVRFEQTLAAVMTLGGVLGLWLLLNGLLALMGKTLPGGLAWLSIGFGLCYILGAIGYWLGGYEQPILWIGVAVGYLVGPVWAFWLGRLLLRGHLRVAAFLASAG